MLDLCMQKYAKEEGWTVNAYVSYNAIMGTILFKLHNEIPTQMNSFTQQKLYVLNSVLRFFSFSQNIPQSHHHQPKSCSLMNVLYLQ